MANATAQITRAEELAQKIAARNHELAAELAALKTRQPTPEDNPNVS